MLTMSFDHLLVQPSLENLKEKIHDKVVMTSQDPDNGDTILHGAAKLGMMYGSSTIGKILDVLFQSPHIDFSIKNRLGDTPMHVVAKCCCERVTFTYLFRAFLSEAKKRKFDFNTLNGENMTTLHLVAIYYRHDFIHQTNATYMLQHGENLDLDIVDDHGMTVVDYLLKNAKVDEVETFLIAGAKPVERFIKNLVFAFSKEYNYEVAKKRYPNIKKIVDDHRSDHQ